MATFYAERAKGGAGLIVTERAPNRKAGCCSRARCRLAEAEEHKVVTGPSTRTAVNPLQILHGRYAYTPCRLVKKKAPSTW